MSARLSPRRWRRRRRARVGALRAEIVSQRLQITHLETCVRIERKLRRRAEA